MFGTVLRMLAGSECIFPLLTYDYDSIDRLHALNILHSTTRRMWTPRWRISIFAPPDQQVHTYIIILFQNIDASWVDDLLVGLEVKKHTEKNIFFPSFIMPRAFAHCSFAPLCGAIGLHEPNEGGKAIFVGYEERNWALKPAAAQFERKTGIIRGRWLFLRLCWDRILRPDAKFQVEN